MTSRVVTVTDVGTRFRINVVKLPDRWIAYMLPPDGDTKYAKGVAYSYPLSGPLLTPDSLSHFTYEFERINAASSEHDATHMAILACLREAGDSNPSNIDIEKNRLVIVDERERVRRRGQ